MASSAEAKTTAMKRHLRMSVIVGVHEMNVNTDISDKIS